jgi:hypothetical protein
VSSDLRPCEYNYSIGGAYKKLEHLIGNVVLFRRGINPEEYTCGKLARVKIIELKKIDPTGKFAINIEFEGLTIQFRYKPSVREIKEYFQRFDKMSEREKKDYVASQYGYEKIELARAVQRLFEIEKKAKLELSKIPRWKLLKRRKKKRQIKQRPKVKEAAKDFVEATESCGLAVLEPLEEGDYPMIRFHYGSSMRRVNSKDMVESMQAIKI